MDVCIETRFCKKTNSSCFTLFIVSVLVFITPIFKTISISLSITIASKLKYCPHFG